MRDPKSYEGFDHQRSHPASRDWINAYVAFWYARGKARARSLGKGSLWEVHRQASCSSPVSVLYVAVDGDDAKLGLGVVALFRCRRCDECKRMKSMDWAHRAVREVERSARSWMGTLTVAPDQWSLIDARIAAAGATPDRSRLSDADFSRQQFRVRAGYLGHHVSGWLDLVRRWAALRGASAGECRYLLVAEAHRSGLPHMHILLHEGQGGFLVRGNAASAMDNGEVVYRRYRLDDGNYRSGYFMHDVAMVRKTWELGHSKFQLCHDSKEAFYLCKYISKEMGGARVRASLHYGDEVDVTKRSESDIEDPSLEIEETLTPRAEE